MIKIDENFYETLIKSQFNVNLSLFNFFFYLYATIKLLIYKNGK